MHFPFYSDQTTDYSCLFSLFVVCVCLHVCDTYVCSYVWMWPICATACMHLAINAQPKCKVLYSSVFEKGSFKCLPLHIAVYLTHLLQGILPATRITDVRTVAGFTVLEIWTQVLMLAWAVLYNLTELSPQPMTNLIWKHKIYFFKPVTLSIGFCSSLIIVSMQYHGTKCGNTAHISKSIPTSWKHPWSPSWK